MKAQGVAKPCITSQLVEESYRNGTFQEEDKIIEGVAGSLYGGTSTIVFETLTDALDLQLEQKQYVIFTYFIW